MVKAPFSFRFPRPGVHGALHEQRSSQDLDQLFGHLGRVEIGLLQNLRHLERKNMGCVGIGGISLEDM